MISRTQVFDSDTIDQLRWPASELPLKTKSYLLPFIKSSPRNFIANADVRMMVCAIDSLVLPLIVCADRLGNSDVCSPYSHFVDYTLEEMEKREGGVGRAVLKTLVRGAAFAMRISQIDKAVYLNNWLLTTNPCPELSPDQIADLTAHLIKRFPGHALILPSVTPNLHGSLYNALRKNAYMMVPSRIVYLFDPFDKSSTARSNLKQDRKLLKNSPYQVIGADEIAEDDIVRITELYQKVYLKKHTPLNPQLKEEYFSLALKEKIFTTKALKKDTKIDAFVCWYSNDGLITASLLGYDTDLPSVLGLYRQAVAIVMTEASDQGKLLHLSGGAGSFKILRGGEPRIEYDAVYTRHLPYYRHLGWYCAWAGGIFQHAKAWKWT